ncbi:MAG: PQQ-binding-like beta-propeller repeat protein [Frankiaceae bacterium]
MPTHRHRARRTSLALAAAGALLLAGCDDGGTGISSTSGAGAPSSPTGGPGTAAPSPARTGAASASGTSTWPAYHHDGERTGVATGMPAVGPLRIAWRLKLDGAMYASPILANGGVLAATERDSVYFVKQDKVVWHRSLGTPVTSGLPCGNIDPLGITGTPVYAASTNTVYVAAELAGPVRHALFALDAGTGRTRWYKSLDVPGLTPSVQQQRPALALSHGNVFVAMGALAGDCGAYNGWVIGVHADGSGSPFRYKTPGTEGGIWTPPGPVTEGDGSLLVSVGNGGATSASDPYDYSDSVLRLSATTLARLSSFSPSVWRDDNAGDLDLGSNGPARVHLSAGDRVVIAGKRGVVYLLRDGNLGGIGGSLARLSGCAAYGGSAVSGSVVYLPCSDGVRALQVGASSLRFRWHASPAGSPVVGGGAVWSIDPSGGTLYALSPSTGAVLRHISVGTTSRFATPALRYDGHVLVPTLDGIVSVAGG